jgi:D-3-phosphoglycerate dehydrogenase / 2-oxoglutarate reductase
MEIKKVLMIDTVHEAFASIVEQHNFICDDGTKWSREAVLQHIHGYEGVVIRSRFRLDETFFAAAEQLKFVARSGAGMENIDVSAAERRNITLINAPEGNRDAVAEHAMAMLLALLNRLLISDNEVRNGIWKRNENRGTELNGKTVAVIGFGNMGAAFAQRLTGFAVDIIAYDKYVAIDKVKYPFVKQVAYDEVFANADVVSLHVPLTAETKYLVNDLWLNQFKKPVYIINTARGSVLETEALVKSINSGKVLGACLDVSEYESISFEHLSMDALPAPWQYLVKSDKVILTPHIAGWSYESYRKLSEVMANKVLTLYNKH